MGLKVAKILLMLSMLWVFNAVFASEVLRVGVEDTDYAPHYFTETDGWHGFAADVLDEFVGAHGLELELHVLPVERLWRDFSAARLAFKYPASPHWKPDAKKGLDIYYSNPVISYSDTLMIRPDQLNNSIEAVGVIRGFSPVAIEPWLASGEISLIEGDDFHSLVRLTMAGRIDAIYADQSVVRHAVKQIQSESAAGPTIELVPYPDLLPDVGYFQLATIGQPDIIALFNRWMQLNKKWLSDLKADYFGDTPNNN